MKCLPDVMLSFITGNGLPVQRIFGRWGKFACHLKKYANLVI